MRDSRAGCGLRSVTNWQARIGRHRGRAAASGHGVPLLRPEEQVFEAMLGGWRNQQLARNLALSTINGRERKVRAFATHADAFPWTWSSQLAD